MKNMSQRKSRMQIKSKISGESKGMLLVMILLIGLGITTSLGMVAGVVYFAPKNNQPGDHDDLTYNNDTNLPYNPENPNDLPDKPLLLRMDQTYSPNPVFIPFVLITSSGRVNYNGELLSVLYDQVNGYSFSPLRMDNIELAGYFKINVTDLICNNGTFRIIWGLHQPQPSVGYYYYDYIVNHDDVWYYGWQIPTDPELMLKALIKLV